MKRVALEKAICITSASVIFAAQVMSAQPVSATLSIGAVDPGVRAGVSAGGPLPGLTMSQRALFDEAKDVFSEVGSVSGTIPGEEGKGLGPMFNLNGCAGCHIFPAVGGSSPRINPQVALATLHGARNVVPSFITLDGPIREVRFKKNPDGSADGGVHALFSIRGRVDAPSNCQLQQTDFATQFARGNAVFRIPTPTFGLGLVGAISDQTILINKTANALAKAALGISGKDNRNGNDGTMTRFGWKAQNVSLPVFAGEAYNVEQGVTNELFPNSRETAPGCDAGTPEDSTFNEGEPGGDVIPFALFMQLLAPPTPAASYGSVSSASIQRGHLAFVASGCTLCHTETMNTGTAHIAALSNKPVNLFSDLLVHAMGDDLKDDVAQGRANGDEFRTAPLWGLGQRIFLLHDGRTKNLVDAIRAHSSRGSEANGSVLIFSALPTATQQDVLNFLRSLE